MKREQPMVTSDQRMDTYLRLRALTGYPTRITFSGEQHPDRPLRVPGILERVVVTGLLVDLEAPTLTIQPEDPVHVEILAKEALIQFHTKVSDMDASRRFYFQLPEKIEELQRRRHPRVDVQMASSCMTTWSDAAVPIQIVNLSAGGAAYSIYMPQAGGAQVTLRLATLGLAPAEIPARVVRCTPVDSELWVVAVAFEKLNPAQETKIAQYVSAVLNEP